MWQQLAKASNFSLGQRLCELQLQTIGLREHASTMPIGRMPGHPFWLFWDKLPTTHGKCIGSITRSSSPALTFGQESTLKV